jgi:hypothetical protein
MNWQFGMFLLADSEREERASDQEDDLEALSRMK